MPRVANGLRFDRRLFRNRGDVFEAEYRYSIRKHPGAIRLLNYENRANAGNYSEAVRQAELTGGTPDVTSTRRNGTLKYGFGLNVEQEITKDIGVFARLGWNEVVDASTKRLIVCGAGSVSCTELEAEEQNQYQVIELKRSQRIRDAEFARLE